MEAQDEGAGDEVKLTDDGGSWESDMKTSSSDAMEIFDGAILILGRLTDGNGEEGRPRKRGTPSLRLGIDRTHLARLFEERNSTS